MSVLRCGECGYQTTDVEAEARYFNTGFCAKCRGELESVQAYGPMLRAIQDMWAEHDERAQGSCGCPMCSAGHDLFLAACEQRESRR